MVILKKKRKSNNIDKIETIKPNPNIVEFNILLSSHNSIKERHDVNSSRASTNNLSQFFFLQNSLFNILFLHDISSFYDFILNLFTSLIYHGLLGKLKKIPIQSYFRTDSVSYLFKRKQLTINFLS